MENNQPPTEPAEIYPNENPKVQDHANDAPKKFRMNKFWPIFVIIPIVLVAIIVPATLRSQTVTSRAAEVEQCRLITKVLIDPGKIETFVGYPPTNLSVLAYDYYGKPINGGVDYEWGMSSTNGIGTIKANRDLASFFPLRTGTGDLYVKAKNKCTSKAVIGSIKVLVRERIIIPIPTATTSGTFYRKI